jgi:hypothetical protein
MAPCLLVEDHFVDTSITTNLIDKSLHMCVGQMSFGQMFLATTLVVLRVHPLHVLQWAGCHCSSYLWLMDFK